LSTRGKNLLLTVSTVVLTLLLCEVGLRLWNGVSLTDFSNFRRRGQPAVRVVETVTYDPVLSWTMKEHVERPDLHTVAFGIRRSSSGQGGPRPGHILAVGGSITEGIARPDEQSWPAQLERLIGEPVDNAAVPAYGLDQSVLRAEQLLAVERPRVLLVAVARQNMQWTGRTVSWGWPKPFFTVEAGALVAHNNPVPRARSGAFEPIKDVLGHSVLIDEMMSRIDPDGWLTAGISVRGGSPDPMDVSCRLLERLKKELDELNIRAVLVPEPTWVDIARTDQPRELAQAAACGQRMGYRVVDSVAAFSADYTSDPERTAKYFTRDREHYSETGSRRIAEVVASALTREPQGE
jgi:hypothetical protein